MLVNTPIKKNDDRNTVLFITSQGQVATYKSNTSTS